MKHKKITAIAADPHAVIAVVDAAPGTPIHHLTPEEVTEATWSEADLVLLVDGAWDDEHVARLPARRRVWLVGSSPLPPYDGRLALLAERGYELPESAAEFADALGRVLDGHPPDRCLITLVGATGGVGTSSLAAAVALHAALMGLRSILIDFDHLAGGPGRHFAAPGAGPLDGVSYELAVAEPGNVSRFEAALGIRAASHGHDVVVIDCPRNAAAADTAVGFADHVLMLAPAAARQQPSIAAAAGWAREINARTELILRQLGSAPPAAGFEAFGLKVAAVLEDEDDLSIGAPGADPFGPLARVSRHLLQRYLGAEGQDSW